MHGNSFTKKLKDSVYLWPKSSTLPVRVQGLRGVTSGIFMMPCARRVTTCVPAQPHQVMQSGSVLLNHRCKCNVIYGVVCKRPHWAAHVVCMPGVLSSGVTCQQECVCGCLMWQDHSWQEHSWQAHSRQDHSWPGWDPYRSIS